ncbi:MAG TPA: hypothetical protein EYP57_02725, partial [Thermodesulfobacteriaceae bacterium]|nr:hypothetical protein [Thermodesulfobacteriaceae bacterium]
MKKSGMTMVMAVLFVLSLVTASMAASGDVCDHRCKNTKTGNILMGRAAEGQELGVDCHPFDYESAEGYCLGTHYTADCSGNVTSPGNRLFFKVCDCENAADIIADDEHIYKVKVTILTEGVYWDRANCSLNGAVDRIDLTRWADMDDACGNCSASNGTLAMDIANYLDAEIGR